MFVASWSSERHSSNLLSTICCVEEAAGRRSRRSRIDMSCMNMLSISHPLLCVTVRSCSQGFVFYCFFELFHFILSILLLLLSRLLFVLNPNEDIGFRLFFYIIIFSWWWSLLSCVDDALFEIQELLSSYCTSHLSWRSNLFKYPAINVELQMQLVWWDI